MPRQTKAEKQLEARIDTLCQQHARGRQIPIMKIGGIYKAAEAAAAAGTDIEAAIVAAMDLVAPLMA